MFSYRRSANLTPGEVVEISFPASHSERWAVGGTLTVTDRRIVFTPNQFELKEGAVERSWDRGDVVSIEVALRGRKLIDGSIRRRLQINFDSVSDYFVVRGVHAKVRELRKLLGLDAR